MCSVFCVLGLIVLLAHSRERWLAQCLFFPPPFQTLSHLFHFSTIMTYLNVFFIFPDASKLLFPAEKRGPPRHRADCTRGRRNNSSKEEWHSELDNSMAG